MSLPSGYKRREYIQSSGTQYIDTGFKPNNNTKVVIDFELTENTGKHQIIFGARSSSSSEQYVLGFAGHRSPAVWRSDFGSNQVTFSSNLTWSGNHNATKNGNICTLDAESVTNTASTFESTVNLFICAGNTGGNVDNYTKAKVYSCKIYDNGTLARDFIPCKNASGVVGMWDDVNSVFYQNAGSGTFTAGPEIAGTHKVLIDGTLYDAKGGRPLIGGTGYSLKKGRTLVGGTGYDISFVSYDPVFSNNEWSAIIDACQSGNVPETWVVGDHKNMTINGASYQIDIIGKNHDTYAAGGTAPLTFQMHDCYNTDYPINSSNTNYGGWKNSAMRTTHLPAILALMPTEVQNGIRKVNKKTSVGNASSTIETVSDELFLLSMIEVFGFISDYAAAGEGTQYDYYKAGNSKAKKRRGIAVLWWLRSPRVRYDIDWCYVDTDGYVGSSGPIGALSVAFGFCF